MEKKYYDLITSLIKNHRKYSGLESILEELVEDVYEHAKGVLDSVSDEGVVTSYLCKIVTTSLITVPKRLNINTRPVKTFEPTIIKASSPEKMTEDTVTTEQDDIVDLKAFNETVEESSIEPVDSDVIEDIDDMIEIMDNSDEIQTTEENDEIESLEDTNNSDIVETDKDADIITDDIIEITEEEIPEIIEDVAETILSEDITEEEALNEIQEVAETPVEVNRNTLVEKMINGVSNEPNEPIESVDNTETFEKEEEIVEEIIEDVTEVPETLEIEAEEDSDFDLIVDSQEESEIFETDELVEDSEMSIEEDLTIDTDENLDLLDSEENIEADLVGVEIEEQEESDTLSETEPSSIYDCFEFEPEESDIADFEDEINKNLAEIDRKYPDKHILKICKLKYKENYSVTKIAETLNISTKNVLESLYEIIDVVKD